jgi:hypothetical protein
MSKTPLEFSASTRACPGAPFKAPRGADICTVDDSVLAAKRKREDDVTEAKQALLDKRKAGMRAEQELQRAEQATIDERVAARRGEREAEDAERAAFLELMGA